MTYLEKLRDPRWQKLRLEVFHKAHFSCERCGETEKTLHVHHKRYIKGREPWEYETFYLECLCEQCHTEAHDGIDKLEELIMQVGYDGPANRDQAWALIAGLLDVGLENALCFLGNHKSYEAMYKAGQQFSQGGKYWEKSLQDQELGGEL